MNSVNQYCENCIIKLAVIIMAHNNSCTRILGRTCQTRSAPNCSAGRAVFVLYGRTCNLATGQRQWQDHAPAMDTTTTRFLNGVITINYELEGRRAGRFVARCDEAWRGAGHEKTSSQLLDTARQCSQSLLPPTSPQRNGWVFHRRQPLACISNALSHAQLICKADRTIEIKERSQER